MPTMALNRRRPLSLLSVAVAAATIPLVPGQRIKQGCFDSSQLSCDNDAMLPIEDGSLSSLSQVEVEEVCTWMGTEVFPVHDIFLDTSQHAEYINGFDPDSEECLRINQAYSGCIFCASEDHYFDCYHGALWNICGGLPTLEQILSDPANDFETQQDIDQTCARIEEASFNNLVSYFDSGMPSSIELCDKQQQVKHLCPGICDGGCFDGPTGIPPSCNPDRYSTDYAPESPYWEECDFLHYNYLDWIPYPGGLFNISTHADYLKAIPGNSTDCHEAQHAYASCFWCATDRCFDEDNPPSCNQKTDLETLDMTLEEINSYCSILYSTIHAEFGEFTPEFYNDSLHHDVFLHGKGEFCPLARAAYPHCINCYDPAIDGTEEITFCLAGDWCFEDAEIPDDFVVEPLFADLNVTANPDMTCNETHVLWKERWYNPYTIDGCYRDVWLHRQCPEQFCNLAPPDSPDYLGASTDAEKKALIWMSRAASTLSFLGAIFILYDIFAQWKNRRELYYELLVYMAIFDLVTAIAWGFSTAPIDTEKASHVYGAHGNAQTCTTQAFFIQLGFTSIFYNVSLAAYYVLVVAYGWKEFQLRPYRPYMHGIPVLVGLGLALGGIPIYHWLEYGCHIQTLSEEEGNLWQVLVFVVIPIGFSIAAITASMLVVYFTVRKHAKQGGRWRLGSGRSSTLEVQVFWQSVFYVMAFYVSWPILITIYLTSADADGPLGLTMTVAFVAPLQGFNNFLVYIRPRLKTYIINRRKMVPSSKQTSSKGAQNKGSNFSGGGTTDSTTSSSARGVTDLAPLKKDNGSGLANLAAVKNKDSDRSCSSPTTTKDDPTTTKDPQLDPIQEVGTSDGNAPESSFEEENVESQNDDIQNLPSPTQDYQGMDPSVLITKISATTVVEIA